MAPWMDPRTARLPGVLPVEGDDWLLVDDAYAGQMAERTRLIDTQLAAVHGLLPQAQAAADELYKTVLAHLDRADGFRVGQGAVLRPDGVEVALDPDMPLKTLGLLVQEDLCLMEKQGEEHLLTGAILCFPASWALAEKLGRPLVGIHRPVPEYDPDLARRVQRMFDAIRPGQPLWRANALVYRDPTLHQPRREADPRIDRRGGSFVRSERQCFLRLPESRAVVFSIHTYVVDIATLSREELAGLEEARL
jgi:dimethylamine monooxygenase subunit A